MLIDVPRLRGYGGPFSDVVQAVRGACATTDSVAIIFVIIIITSTVIIVIVTTVVTIVINTVIIVMIIIIVIIVIGIVITDRAQGAFALEVHRLEVRQAALG